MGEGVSVGVVVSAGVMLGSEFCLGMAVGVGVEERLGWDGFIAQAVSINAIRPDIIRLLSIPIL